MPRSRVAKETRHQELVLKKMFASDLQCLAVQQVEDNQGRFMFVFISDSLREPV